MANLLESELEAVHSNPINGDLDSFVTEFASKYPDANIRARSGDFEILSTNPVGKSLVLKLIGTLQLLPAATALTSRFGNGPLSGEIALLFARLSSDKVAMTHATRLLKVVVTQAKDVDLWTAAFDLISSTRTATPPTTYQNTLLDTPFRPSSAEQRGSEQTRDEVDQRIFEELQERVYDNVTGFYERFFESKSWTDAADQAYHTSKILYTDERWDKWPEPPLQEAFFDWFRNLQETVLSRLH